MQISVRLDTGKAIPLDVEYSYTLKQLKAMIKDKTNIPTNEQKLIFREKPMEDDEKTLLDYGVSEDDTIYLIMMFSSGYCHVRLSTGKVIPLEPKLSYTIKQIKLMIQEKEKISVDQQNLIFIGEPMEDDEKTLSDYGVCKDDTIYLVMISNIKVHVKLMNGKVITLEAKLSYTIKQIKLMIQEKEKIPVDKQHLIFSGNLLIDEKTLKQYDIPKESTMYLIENSYKK